MGQAGKHAPLHPTLEGTGRIVRRCSPIAPPSCSKWLQWAPPHLPPPPAAAADWRAFSASSASTQATNTSTGSDRVPASSREESLSPHTVHRMVPVSALKSSLTSQLSSWEQKGHLNFLGTDFTTLATAFFFDLRLPPCAAGEWGGRKREV